MTISRLKEALCPTLIEYIFRYKYYIEFSFKVNILSCELNISTFKVKISSCELNILTFKVNISICKLNISSCKLNISTFKVSTVYHSKRTKEY